MLEITSDTLINAGKHATLKTECACSQQKKKIQSSDWPKWCASWRNVVSGLLLDQMSFEMVGQTSCR